MCERAAAAADDALSVPHRVLLFARVSARPLAHAQAVVSPRRSRASSRTASEVSVAAAAEAAGPTFATTVAAQSTQNGDRREGEAYAASTAATYDGSTASGADADTDEWSRSRAYSAASAPSTAAVYDGSAASGAGEDTADDWSREGPTRDDVTARARGPRQPRARRRHGARGSRPRAARPRPRPTGAARRAPNSPQEKFVRVWSAADEAAAAEVFDLTTPHEARDFDAAVDIEDVRRDLRGASGWRRATTTWARRPRRAPASVRVREAFEARSRGRRSGRTARRGGQVPREAAVRVRDAFAARSREEPVLTDAALDALLPAEGFGDAGSSAPRPVVLRPVFADEFPMVADATAAVSSFLFGGTPPRAARTSITTSAARRPGRGAPPVEDADDWHQAVDDAGVPYFVSATGETARRPPAGSKATARGTRRRGRGSVSGPEATGSRPSTTSSVTRLLRERRGRRAVDAAGGL